MVLDNLSFPASAGDLIWITGSNGSGKTSLLKSISGLIAADEGQIKWSQKTSDIAYLGHSDSLKRNLTVCENLEFWQAIYQSTTDLELAMKQVDVWRLRDLAAKKLSAGQSRRVALARLLLKNASLWLLDEPAAPLDLLGQKTLTDIISSHLSDNGIAIIATHAAPFKIGTNSHVLKLRTGDDA